jgi:tetratricopeptide (TPR) repeat protein
MRSKSKKCAHQVFFFVAFACLVLLSNCSLPRIHILRDPLTPEEHLNLGVSYEEKGELESALKEYRLASKKLPRGYLYVGNVYSLKKEWAEAEKNYRKAIKEDPQNAEAYNNLAWLYYTKGENLIEAENLALKALELSPLNTVYQDTLQKIKEKKLSFGAQNH